MSAPMDLEAALRAALEAGAAEAEAVLVESNVVEAQYVAGRLRVVEYSELQAGVLAALEDGRVGGAGGNVASQDQLSRLAQRAVELARSSRPIEGWVGFNDRPSSSDVETFDPSVEGFDSGRAVELLKTMEGEVRASGARMTEGGVRASTSRLWVMNTRAWRLQGYASTLFSAGLEAEAGEGASYGDWVASRRLSEDSAVEAAREAARRAPDVGRARPPESGRYTVVFTPKALSELILSALAPAFSGEAVLKKRSPLAGRLGERVVEADLRIVDDPTIPFELGSRPFDAEGYASKPRVLVEGGVLKSYLHTRLTAARLGGEPGNAAKPRPWSVPTPSPSNLVLEPPAEQGSPESLLEGRAILVVSTMGAWLSNPVSGRASATVTLGYLNTPQGPRPVKGFVVAGDIYRMLSTARGAGPRECWFGLCAPHTAFEADVAGR